MKELHRSGAQQIKEKTVIYFRIEHGFGYFNALNLFGIFNVAAVIWG